MLHLFTFLGPLAMLPAAAEAQPEAVTFQTHVLPIVTKHCVSCHGAKTQEAGLRLDNLTSALHGGDSGPAVVKGEPDKSPLIAAVEGSSADVSRMPLDEKPLSSEEIARLRLWIKRGANGDAPQTAKRRSSDHWSFQPIVRHAPPGVEDQAWPRNPIDHFILARLEAAGIKPSPEADKAALLRRASLDLIGLPPTPQQLDAFLADDGPDAYEKVVDRLLASPHFGEHWGRYWLDAARYADSNGYTIDGPREIWKYRDWVIDALNRNIGFDRFAIEQLAGDMLPQATVAQRIATGFHRNTMFNQEGGTDPEQFRVERVVDRVNTTGEVFLGLTLGCAQCHSHKYDPISQRDYFQVYAFFNNADEPTLPVPTPEQKQRDAAVRAKLAPLTKELAARDKQLSADFKKWYTMQRAVLSEWKPLQWTSATSAGRAKLQPADDDTLFASGPNADSDVYELVAQPGEMKVHGLRLETLVDARLPKQGPGRAANGNFVLCELTVAVSKGADSFTPIKIKRAEADFSQPKYPVSHAVDGKRNTGWAINTNGKGDMNVDRTAVFEFERPVSLGVDSRLRVTMLQSVRNKGYNIGRFRVCVVPASTPVQLVSRQVEQILRKPANEWSKLEKKELAAAQKKLDPVRRDMEERIQTLQQKLSKPATTMVMQERKEPRSTFVHLRGDFLRKGAEVSADVPGVLPPLPKSDEADRLDFARWLVSDDNPLTPRVTVNRYWQRLFGVGLVETENDFGTQGTEPTHPKLLDWLAGEFVRQQWDVKRTIRLIVTSATYRQASHHRDDLASVDPTNRLLARQRRLRLRAESIRDSALAVSGLLTYQLGGPSVFPYQPKGVMDLPQVERAWNVSTGGDQYRRGLYTYFWRSSPHPMLRGLDGPDAQTTCTKRGRSNTPLQALMLLNDFSVIDCARSLAAHVAESEATSDSARLTGMFRRCLGRSPTPSEHQILTDLYAEQRNDFTTDEPASRALAGLDTSSPDKAADRAALTIVARMLLNLDEFITRE